MFLEHVLLTGTVTSFSINNDTEWVGASKLLSQYVPSKTQACVLCVWKMNECVGVYLACMHWMYLLHADHEQNG